MTHQEGKQENFHKQKRPAFTVGLCAIIGYCARWEQTGSNSALVAFNICPSQILNDYGGCTAVGTGCTWLSWHVDTCAVALRTI